MELDRIQLLCLIFSGCHRAVRRMGCDLEAGRDFGNVVKMAHPADSLRRYPLEYLGCLFINQNFCLSILSYFCALYFSAKYMRHQLCAIAETKHRNPQFEKLLCVSR